MKKLISVIASAARQSSQSGVCRENTTACNVAGPFVFIWITASASPPRNDVERISAKLLKLIKCCLLTLLLFLPLAAHAEPTLDYSEFTQIPILHEGRIKPLGSFARVMLKEMSGQKFFAGQGAPAWLASVLFTPADAMKQKLFTIHAPGIVATLGLPETADKTYDFAELSQAFAAHENAIKAALTKDPKQFSEEERELAELTTATKNFAELAAAFSLLLPLNDIDEPMRASLHLKPSGDIDYLEVLKSKDALMRSLTQTVKTKGDDVEHYTQQEAQYAKLAFTLHLLETLDRENNNLLRVIPPLWEGVTDWLSPWAVIREGAGSPQSARLFAHWQTLAVAYRTQDAALWKLTAHALLQETAHAQGVRPWALKLETDYNACEPLHISLIGYGVAVLVLCLGWVRCIPSARISSPFRERIKERAALSSGKGPLPTLSLKGEGNVRTGAYCILLISLLIHVCAIVARMAILSRPPVSTLYESMIFVSAVAVSLGLWMERGSRSAGGLAVSALMGAFLLIAADIFAGSSDTLEVLVAVLNTNFWLATHVVCITTGYSTALITGALAHLYLFKRANPRTDAAELAAASKRIYHAALIALLFTAVGTMLGGIWADQSWGRFWGWDPKENGALWIVLWLIWMLHGRLAGQLRELGFAVTGALITIVVALAWVGVNLLGVGLHSYGFTNTAANGLLVFCGGELVVIMSLAGVIFRQR